MKKKKFCPRIKNNKRCQNCHSEHFLLLRNKKAQVESQFNWIFILAVGAVILIFFVGIVMRQKASSETKISETVMTDLQSIFTGGSVSTGTSQLIETPKVEIGFDCGNYYLKGVTRPVENLIIFAPTTVQGRNIITWTLDYNLPYKITDVLYITSPEMRYIFVGDQAWLKEMNTTLPKEMNKEMIETANYDAAKIEDKNNYKVRMIFKGTAQNPPTRLAKMGKDLTALEIKGETLKFYESNGNTFVPQPGPQNTYTAEIQGQLKTTLYGAVFTDDIDIYGCMTGKALKRAYFVSTVYAERNRNISDYFTATNSYCDLFKFNPNDFDSFVQQIGQAYETFRTDPQAALQHIEQIKQKAQTITTKNKQLLQKSCPLIY